MPSLKFYDPVSQTYKYVAGGMSKAEADAEYAKKSVFPNEATRNAAIPSPYDGQRSYVQDLHQEQTYCTVASPGWYPSGGVLPRGYLEWGATALTANGNYKWVLAPSVTQAPQGGMTYNMSTGAVIAPYRGVYLVEGRIAFDQVPTANAVAAGCGNQNGAVFYGACAHNITNGVMRSPFSGSWPFAAGDNISLYYQNTTGSATQGWLSVAYLCPWLS